MVRKGHKKSRKGCYHCKNRHVKCDEQLPSCGRCVSSGRPCLYVRQTAQLQTELDLDLLASNSPTTQLEDSTLRVTSGSFVHLELFHNFEQSTCRTVARTEEHINIYRSTIIQRAFVVPYLMQALLGLSALHLSLQSTERKDYYKHAATILQSQALEHFDTGLLENVTKDNVLDILLFQHLVGLHVFCDVFTTLQEDFGIFLESMIGSIQLLRGVNSVTTTWWHVLSKTALGAIMVHSDSHQNSPHNSEMECAQLHKMLDSADLSAHSIEVCRRAIDSLQVYLDAENELGEQPIESTNMLFAWLITASPEYTTLLGRRRPEALVILAYYSVLLYRRRRSWAIANAGQCLLRQIQRYLGRDWEPYLAWPHEVIQTSMDDQTM